MEKRKNIRGVPYHVGVLLSKPQEGKRYQIRQKDKVSLFKTEKQAIDFYNNNVKKGSGAQIKDIFEKQNEEFQNFFKNPEVYKRYYKGSLTASSIEDIWKSLSPSQRRTSKSLFQTKLKNINESNKLEEQGYMRVTDLADELNRSSSMELIRNMKESNKFNKLFPNYLKNTVTDSSNKLWIKTDSETLKKLKEWAEDPFAKGLRETTIENVKEAYKNKELMNYWKKWKVGTPIDQELIDSVHGRQGSAYTMMQLGRTLQGKEPIEGIQKNIALGNKIIEAVRYKAKEYGDWHTAAYKYAKQDMDTFLPPGKKGITFGDYQRLLTKSLKEIGLENFNIDEINALRSGVRGGTQPYSVFSQILEGKYNQGVKRRFDAENAKNQMKLNFALNMRPDQIIKIRPTAAYSNKARNPINLNKSEYINYVINLQDNLIDNFFEKIPDLKGKISLPRFDLRDPKTVYGSRFNTFDEGVQNAILKNYEEVGYTLDVGKKALTQKELLNSIKNFTPQQKTNFLKKFGRYGLLGGLAIGLTGFTDINAYANSKNKNQTDQQLETAQTDQMVEGQAPESKLAENISYNPYSGFVKADNPEEKASQSDLLYWIADNEIMEDIKEIGKTVGEIGAVIGGATVGLGLPDVKKTVEEAKAAGKSPVKSVLGKGFYRLGSPFATAAFTIPQALDEKVTATEMATDPLNYLGLATMETLGKRAGTIAAPAVAESSGILGALKNYATLKNVGEAVPGKLNAALRLGLSPRVIAGASRFLGIPGLIASGAYTLYDYLSNKESE